MPLHLHRVLTALSAALLVGCECIDVPATDTVDPNTVLTLIWNEGGEQTLSVNTTDGVGATAHLESDEVVQVFVAGSDDGGVRSIGLEGQQRTPNTITHVDFPGHSFADCAKTYRAANYSVQRSLSSNSIQLRATSADFHGNLATTPWIIVHFDR
jgi:hypothetical protein